MKVQKKKGSRTTRVRAKSTAVSRADDTMDADLQDHVGHFIENFTSGLRIEKLNLTTREGAEEALTLLDSLQRRIEQKQHTAEILRDLLKAKAALHGE